FPAAVVVPPRALLLFLVFFLGPVEEATVEEEEADELEEQHRLLLFVQSLRFLRLSRGAVEVEVEDWVVCIMAVLSSFSFSSEAGEEEGIDRLSSLHFLGASD